MNNEETEILNIENKNKKSMLELYGNDLITKEYITNPAIARNEEIKKMILSLLIPEKSVIIVGKPGVGKTALVEGLAYKMQKNDVPDALKKYKIIKINIVSLIGNVNKNGISDSKVQTLINELKNTNNVILFIDEIHTVIGNKQDDNSSIDLANMLKAGLDRGTLKIIGATTNIEFNQYINKDRAFLRRFEKIELEEPNIEKTIEILIGTIPKIEKQTEVKLDYPDFVINNIITFIVNMTSEYKRIYESSSQYPDIALELLTKIFSFAIYDNKSKVGFKHIWEAVKSCESVYEDVLIKEKNEFKKQFLTYLQNEKVNISNYNY